MKKLTIDYVDPRKLRPNDWNTNHVSPENERKLEASVDQFGVFKPIIVREKDGHLEILGGQHRAQLAARRGEREVPIINLGNISDVRAKEISLIDNGRYGSDDTLELSKLLESLGGENYKDFLPYTDEDFTSIFSSIDIDLDNLGGIDDDEDLPEPINPTAKPVQTHTVMRFKIPVDDAHNITDVIERVMKQQGYTQGDSLTNAGDALVHIFHNTEGLK